ncbi:hypothetical protein [Sphingobacterium multivorum]|uniref:hypothetical protein n=1 Tax=Sphingobacterium siyangense TaxID=459529 RepID=UPI00191AB58B|nr:hypothetical protein [Sphingobacterium multivorum]QQT32766.1 hypothetical protein I6I99_09480 [Sphingobacterium multivorum]
MAFLPFGITVTFEIKFFHVHFIPSAVVVHNLSIKSWTIDSYFSLFKQKRQGVIDIIVSNSGCFKFVKTKRGDLMKFGTFLDAEGRFFDTVHFPQTLAKYPLRGAGVYLVEGKVVLEYGCPSVEVIRFGKMPLKPDPRSE